MTTRFAIKVYPCLALLWATLIFSACTHYELGIHGRDCLVFEHLYIKPIENRSFAPQVHFLLYSQIVEALHRAGIPTTQCPQEADAVLEVVVTDYRKSQADALIEDTDVASAFWVTLEAKNSLYAWPSGKPYWSDQKCSATINAFAKESVQSVLYQDMPQLTYQLSTKIRNLVLSAWTQKDS